METDSCFYSTIPFLKHSVPTKKTATNPNRPKIVLKALSGKALNMNEKRIKAPIVTRYATSVRVIFPGQRRLLKP